jgi:hypothetical protein
LEWTTTTKAKLAEDLERIKTMNPITQLKHFQSYYHTSPLPTTVNGVTESAPKKKVLNEALDQIFGQPNAKTAEKAVIYPPAR